MSLLAKQFDELWESSGSPPNVFEFVERHNGSDVFDLLPVLLVDQKRRWKTDHPFKVEDYLDRMPRLVEFPNAILELMAGEIQIARESSSKPSAEDVIVRLRKLNSFHPKEQLTRTGRFDKDPVFDSNADTRSFIGSDQLDSTLATKNDVTPSVVPSFEDYQLIEEIGRGGMGIVYKALQQKLNRLVALKVIKSGEFADPEQIRRFQSEAEALAKLDHDGIVPVFEVGESQGQHFLSMAFVHGENLNERVKAHGPLSPNDAASLIKLLAEAVQYAHKKGVVHRDIKPHNILIDSESGKPRLTDFGLARYLESDSDLTATGQVMGTPSYMPPEQAAGQRGNVGVASDVYSLGATLYFLLVARPPFQAASTAETIRQVLDSEAVSPRSLNANVPKDLATICLKCLSKEPDRRYASAVNLADDLQRWLSGEPILARPVSRVEKAWKWCKRRPALVGTTAAAILVLIVVSTLLIEGRNSAEATRLVEGLLQAETSQVSSIIDNLSAYDTWAKDDLKTAFDDSLKDSNAKLHSALAMLPDNKSVLPFLKDRLMTVTAMQFAYVRDLLADDKSELFPYYWDNAKEDKAPAIRFQAACTLATYDSENKHWENKDFRNFVAGHLVSVGPSELLPWRNALRPVKEHLTEPLIAIFGDDTQGETVRKFSTDTLVDYLNDDADGLFNLLADSNEKQFATISDKLAAHKERSIELGNAEVTKTFSEDASDEEKELLAMRQANAAVMLLRMNAAEQVWPLLRESPDPRARTYFVHWFRPLDGDPKTILERYFEEEEASIKRALLMCLGESNENRLPDLQRAGLIEDLLSTYRLEPDAGLHAAAEWLLRSWEEAEKISDIDADLKQNEEQLRSNQDEKRKWYVNTQGQTFVILDARSFLMGSPLSETNRDDDEPQHTKRIDRKFAISTKEVTKEQFMKFRTIRIEQPERYPKQDCPMGQIKWYEAAEYCNWLSKQEGIPENQWCYERNEAGVFGAKMKAKERFLELVGYRLPTEAEWEFACRGGTETSRFYGQSNTLLSQYAWTVSNSKELTWPVGSLKPNDYGLFDTYGNVAEWCHDRADNYVLGNSVADNKHVLEIINEEDRRILRGGSFNILLPHGRSAFRDFGLPNGQEIGRGFRPARTYQILP